MAKNIEPKLKKIGDYLKLEEDTVFTIPEYQRAYSWGIDNCDKLWQDINDFVDSESKDRYFLAQSSLIAKTKIPSMDLSTVSNEPQHFCYC